MLKQAEDGLESEGRFLLSPSDLHAFTVQPPCLSLSVLSYCLHVFSLSLGHCSACLPQSIGHGRVANHSYTTLNWPRVFVIWATFEGATCVKVFHAAFTDIKDYILFTQRLYYVPLCLCLYLCVCVSVISLEVQRWVIPAHMLVAVKGIHCNDAVKCDLLIDAVWWSHVCVKCQLFRKRKQAKRPLFQFIGLRRCPVHMERP